MKAAIIIPARHDSTRFPGKPLAPLIGAGGIVKPLIQRSWEAACAVPDVAQVVIATDDDRIADTARGFGAAVVMTSASCRNGTERCAAALDVLDEGIEVIVNLQGDAPLTPPRAVAALLAELAADASVQVATPAMRTASAVTARLYDEQHQGAVGGTTVVIDGRRNALYFSKTVLPYCPPARRAETPVALHLGVYAYRRAALFAYRDRPASALEELEGLEQLRFFDAGVAVRVVEISPADDIWELNNPGDVTLIEAALAARGIA